MVVNEGVIYKPHIVKEIRGNTGQLIQKIEPEILHTSNIRSETFQKVQEGMRKVITEGTARYVITTKAVELAGKTGTGEVGLENSWSSWFVAYGPYSGKAEDQIIVSVNIEATDGKFEWWAPKAANIICHSIFADETFEETIKSLNLSWLFN